MSKPILIYALVEADTKAIRYVGKTVQSRHARLHLHMRDRKRCRKVSWLKSLTNAGRQVEMVDLEVLPPDADWQAAERKWIAHMRAQGCALTNETDGGEGLHNPSPELRKKLGDNRRGKPQPREAVERQRARMLLFRHTEEAKARMSAMAKGRVIAPETRAKLSARFSGQRLSADHAANISAALKGKPKNEAQRANLSIGRAKAHCTESRQKMIDTKRRQAEQPELRAAMIANLGAFTKPAASPEQCVEVRRLRETGLSMRAVAQQVGLKECTARNIILRLGAYKD